MPGQKRRYNVRFPPQRRIKKIMQKDTEVGRIAMAVPVIIRALEMFLKSLLTKTCLITQSKLSAVVSIAHKQCIESEKLFHFLKDLAERTSTTAAQKDNRGMNVW
uniref:Transcription factor CBF/NF-Y/archaeal histone domain-containing protein n=1 Tax=Amphiprion percula TaxID=161767 RepID=A0A3P8S290_AMPPE